ncbi:acetyltransferase (GNAT) family protein [Larkinella arboricola]|uniref:Acetyltransferase (GNAT) family protein n=1 Tax=Larkinella arboricola TaxID=643671 RepID=A0A327WVJ2_LARAB|nr:GNAT family N-acetyltransferase [Larkinella arboricola]RAJ95475.1 acetyltransferase (GNAT) family protein [Larkinella arboricola]
MPIRYEIYFDLPPESLLRAIISLHQRVFVGQTPGELFQEFEEAKDRQMLTLVALDDQAVVGYKMGYQRKPGHFYSWLGCVSPDYRRQGIAGELMRQQHDWCKANGYRAIRTHTRNQWRDMLILNIRHGFDIIGTVTSASSPTTIVLEKTL